MGGAEWMYDRVNLAVILRKVGFENPGQRTFQSSGIPNWEDYGLDRGGDGSEYLPGSLYMEAER